ncbi:hypothetical protein [Tsukamurella sp. PLM1]|uniref:hypothetical protein n=1 Tax=Tsukamurella sp. PLM1 TaxID=2929795 RepID=UPI0020677C4C|nr:hypothetical protein [Tsukamurella sp. PLM1]BDH57810.1 hypothetical protein MTP03_27490 [Tsukamurella sp. PLM1]
MESAGRRPDSAIGGAVLGIGLVLWFAAVLYSYLRISLWVFDLVVVPLMWVLWAVGSTAVVVGAALLRRPLRYAGSLVIVLVVAAVSVTVGAWWQVSPRGWFATHRVLYERALAVDPGVDTAGAALPPHLRFLASGGRVRGDADHPDTRFFPQTSAFPEFSGGFLHSPGGPPEGFNMRPVPCFGPVSLGGDWWMCGMGR